MFGVLFHLIDPILSLASCLFYNSQLHIRVSINFRIHRVDNRGTISIRSVGLYRFDFPTPRVYFTTSFDPCTCGAFARAVSDFKM